MFLFFIEILDVPETDMIFAISATAQLNQLDNFRQMKEIINAMIDKYGTGDLKYSVIVYGDEPQLGLRLNSNFESDETLMNSISSIRSGRGASLSKAVRLANQVE